MPENVIPATQPDTTVAGFPATEDPAYSPPSAHESAEDAHVYDTTRTDTEGKSDQIAPVYAVALTDTGDLVELVGHPYADGDPVVFYQIVDTTGVTAGTVYYVVNANTDDFQVEASVGGGAVTLTTDGTANVHLVITDEVTGVIVSENLNTSAQGTYNLTEIADPAYAAPPNGVTAASQPDTTIGGGSVRVDADPPYRAPAGPVPVTIFDTSLFDGASYSGFLEVAVTLTDTGDLVGATDHGFEDGNVVVFSDIVSTTGLVEGTRYYVINALANSFQVSLSEGGSAEALTTNGTANVQRTTTITDVSGNADMTQVGAVVDLSAPGYSVPAAPTAVTATALDNGEVRVSWTAPSQVTGAPRIGYYVESSLGMSLYVAGNATSVDIQAWRIEADNQQAQTFTVRAVNKNGSGPKSTASAAVDVVNINVGYGALDFPGVDVDPVYEPEGTVLEGSGGTPSVPVIGTLVTGVGEVTANWTQSTVGTPTGYRVNVYDDADDSLIDSADFGLVATGVVTGLPVTAAVYVKVLALDEIENSAESAASNVVAVT